MIQLDLTQKDKIVTALLELRKNYDGTDSAFAKRNSINNAVFSQLKAGKREGMLREAQWLEIARRLNVSFDDRKLKIVRTSVYSMIEEEVSFCQQYSKAMIFVDECEIGKSLTAQHLALTMKNCFYVDCSSVKSKQLFIRLIAKTIGVDSTGKYFEVLENVKYFLNFIPKPVVILDEAGDLEYTAFLELKTLWNGTENNCGWYMIGADGLREKLLKGTRTRKVGFAEIFSRYSSKFSKIVPNGTQDKIDFYQDLIGSVLKANLKDDSKYNEILKQCLIKDETGRIGGFRRLDSLIILHS